MVLKSLFELLNVPKKLVGVSAVPGNFETAGGLMNHRP